ncbi:unnamed protein product, partial [Scytosiphon promiscuus]
KILRCQSCVAHRMISIYLPQHQTRMISYEIVSVEITHIPSVWHFSKTGNVLVECARLGRNIYENKARKSKYAFFVISVTKTFQEFARKVIRVYVRLTKQPLPLVVICDGKTPDSEHSSSTTRGARSYKPG